MVVWDVLIHGHPVGVGDEAERLYVFFHALSRVRIHPAFNRRSAVLNGTALGDSLWKTILLFLQVITDTYYNWHSFVS